MRCEQVELKMPEGYKRDVTVCYGVKLPRNVKGATNKTNLVLINEYEYLEDLRKLGIRYPLLYVKIHEFNHIRNSEKSEYEIREMSDKDYEDATGEKINTTIGFPDYRNYIKRLEKEFN